MPRDVLTLADTQDALFEHIVGASDEHRVGPESFVVGDARASAAERVAVYAFMYRARLVETLASQFPRLAKSLGDDRFAELARGYVDEHPSAQPSLRFLGAVFAEWLASRHLGSRLADLAKLEWARADIFDARDQRVFGPEAIRAWPQDRFAELPVKLVDAHRLPAVARGTADHWRRIGDDGAPDSEGTSMPGAERILVWRQGVAVYHRTVDDAESIVLDLAAAGTNLGRICECAGSRSDVGDAASQSFAWIWSWANDQLLVMPERASEKCWQGRRDREKDDE